MKRKTSRSGFMTGLAVGASLVLLRNHFMRRHPEATLAQKMVDLALDRELRMAQTENAIQLEPGHRYVIFSDHHKGGGDAADDFRQCKPVYLAAMDHYWEQGYTLIVLGDGEELWEQEPPIVFDTYRDVFESEARFHPDRHIRVIGNHDNFWESTEMVQQYLHPYFPGLEMRRSILLKFPVSSGQLLLVHGHQGTIDSDIFDFLPPLVLPLYRQIQNLTGIGRTSPSRDACLRAEHDTMMYRWASQQDKLLLICGHTHRPVWSSLTHLEKLSRELHAMLGLPPDERAQKQDLIDQLRAAIMEREQKHPPCNDTIKTKPSYFNTGCCRFEDGDITGIELDDGVLRLIKWGQAVGGVQRTEFESAPLSAFFALL